MFIHLYDYHYWYRSKLLDSRTCVSSIWGQQLKLTRVGLTINHFYCTSRWQVQLWRRQRGKIWACKNSCKIEENSNSETRWSFVVELEPWMSGQPMQMISLNDHDRVYGDCKGDKSSPNPPSAPSSSVTEIPYQDSQVLKLSSRLFDIMAQRLRT